MAALLMVFTFLVFIFVDIIVQKVQSKKGIASSATSTKNVVPIPFALRFEDLVLPGGLFYHQGHTWAGVDFSGKVKVGMDDFAQKILGRIDGVKLRMVGDNISKGEPIFAIEQGKRKAEFTSPVDGIISSINEEVIKNPSVLKNNPFKKGWIYSIKPSNLSNDIKSLFVSNEAMNWLKNEVQRFEQFIAEHFLQDKMIGKTLADGGVPVEGVMEYMDDFSWLKLQEEFLGK